MKIRNYSISSKFIIEKENEITNLLFLNISYKFVRYFFQY